MKQEEFLKQLVLLVDYAKTKENRLAVREVKAYFSDMKLNEEQMDLIYEYLAEHQIEVKGRVSQQEKIPVSREDSAYLRIYRKEIKALPVRSEEEMNEIYRLLSEGEEGMIQKAIESHLRRVVTIASRYRNHGVLLEDLVQEGNLELTAAIHSMLGNQNIENDRKELDRRIKKRLIDLIDEAMEEAGLENSILAKTNLVYEATKAFAKENGTIADLHELAEYTKMPEDEILELVELSLEEIKIGECVPYHGEADF